MSVLTVKARNYKMHENLNVILKGMSAICIGKSGSGKSTFLEIIEKSLGLIPWGDNPLKAGAEDGEIETELLLDGSKYLVRRRFNKKGWMRIEVVDQGGGSQALEPLLERILGKAFMSSHFDYKKYFFECKSKDARNEYMMKCIGGEPVLANNAIIKTDTVKRNKIGGQRATFEALLEKSIIDPETLEEDKEKYAAEKKLHEVYQDEDYLALKVQEKDKAELEADYALAKELNGAAEEKIGRNIIIDAEVAELKQKIKALESEKKVNEKYVKDNPVDKEYEFELAASLATIEEFNNELQPKIAAALKEAEEKINRFNQERYKFNTDMGYLKTYSELDKEWNALNDEIAGLEQQNAELFKEHLKVPEISVGPDELILYKCKDGVEREMCFPNISKGESIAIAAKIQMALDPKGNAMIVIPEGQSIGEEDIADIRRACHELAIQFFLEMTERKQEFKIVLEDDYSWDDESPEVRKSGTRKAAAGGKKK